MLKFVSFVSDLKKHSQKICGFFLLADHVYVSGWYNRRDATLTNPNVTCIMKYKTNCSIAQAHYRMDFKMWKYVQKKKTSRKKRYVRQKFL